MANKKKFLSKEQVVAAQGKTKSNMAAARYLHVSYQHYKKYAKMYNLFDSHKNQAHISDHTYTFKNIIMCHKLKLE